MSVGGELVVSESIIISVRGDLLFRIQNSEFIIISGWARKNETQNSF